MNYDNNLIFSANITISKITGLSKVQLPGCPRIITRAEWGASPPGHNPMPLLTQVPKYFFIHHGASEPCFTKQECAAHVKSYQMFHMSPPPKGRGWWDIGYSFVAGEDGNIYEARGWDEIGAHTKGYNDVGLAVSFIGDFRKRLPNDAALNAVKQLIECGVANGKVAHNYTLRGHRDVGNTECPGQMLYDLIQTWPHYY
ncbi:hypothetical protein FSP39_022692 [Pinctada imbricata]|uniref:Peptidoglycan-recognition protein n=1 Tax=Pinctada imbricata TaxID=66713 RepID=A0AA88YPF4_PINIB|nr:hypothetical protein FSP39_022692 [Pinctada imbricata]